MERVHYKKSQYKTKERSRGISTESEVRKK